MHVRIIVLQFPLHQIEGTRILTEMRLNRELGGDGFAGDSDRRQTVITNLLPAMPCTHFPRQAGSIWPIWIRREGKGNLTPYRGPPDAEMNSSAEGRKANVINRVEFSGGATKYRKKMSVAA